MAQFYTDFRDEGLGVSPAELSILFGASDITMTTQTGNILANSERSVLIAPTAGNTYARAAAQVDGVSTSGETTVRLLAQWKRSTSSELGSIVGGFVSGTGTDSTRTGYYQWYRNDHSISRYDNGADSAVATVDEGESADAAVRTGYLEIYRNAGLIEIRQWLEATEARPAAPDVSYTDPSPLPVAGALGISAVLNETVSDPNFIIYEVSVATDGDAVPDGPVLTTLRKGTQFTVEESLAGTVVSATLNGNAITVDSHVGTTVTLTDSGSGITTSGEYDLVLTDDSATPQNETISVQVDVVGIPAHTFSKDGAGLANLADIEIDLFNTAGTAVSLHNGGRTTDANGVIPKQEYSDSYVTNVGDTHKVSIYSPSAGVGITFEQVMELI